MDWTPYAVGGAAARSDSFTGLDPQFAAAVYQMVSDAHAAGVPLQITSAYRSPEVQAQLYQNALAKYGSEAAARKWVAPPGKSRHNSGTAVDFALNGSLIRDANSPAAQWIAANAARYGLAVPMDWEPWQVEPMGSRGGGGVSNTPPIPQSPAGAPQEPQNALAAYGQPEQRQTPPANALLDVRDYLTPVNALQLRGFT